MVNGKFLLRNMQLWSHLLNLWTLLIKQRGTEKLVKSGTIVRNADALVQLPTSFIDTWYEKGAFVSVSSGLLRNCNKLTFLILSRNGILDVFCPSYLQFLSDSHSCYNKSTSEKLLNNRLHLFTIGKYLTTGMCNE